LKSNNFLDRQQYINKEIITVKIKIVKNAEINPNIPLPKRSHKNGKINL